MIAAMNQRFLPPPPGLGGLTPEEFLARFWQRKPLLVRGAFPDFRSPISPDELAGLACEEGVLSRIVLENAGERPWEVREGPFEEGVFANLPESGWSLLVQEADRHVSDLTDLLDSFRFVPDWRIDDLMVSYAPEGGSVGAHVDSYDVFLVQAWGRRRWEWGPVTDPELLPDIDLEILRSFHAAESAVLDPGDMLYLPPGVAHHGIALEPCMTFSIGFLAPAADELLASFADEVLVSERSRKRFEDAGRPRPAHPARLEAADLARVRAMVRGLLADDGALDAWFAAHISTSTRSQPLLPPETPPSAGTIAACLEEGHVLRRAEGCRMVFLEGEQSLRLFVEGETLELRPERLGLVEMLAARREFLEEDLAEALSEPESAELISSLVSLGALYLTED
jgi:50S ribosomal protein L16 3-hydroxylase